MPDEPGRRRSLDSLDFVSAGSRGLATADPLVSQQAVPEPDRAPARSARSANGADPQAHRDVSDLLGQPPAVVEKTSGGARVGF